jgi:predicted DNA binding CopG/RHH family protein
MKKKLPKLKTDAEAEKFLEQDLTPYLHAGNFKAGSFEFAAKDTPITMRMPEALLNSVKSVAKKQHVPYQRVIRMAIEQFVIKAA